MKTYSPKPRDIERRWYVIDADGAVLGRLASEVAKILRGKHKPIFAPHADTGDHVIVVNARGVRLTGGKEQEKVYYHHSGFPGGLGRLGYARLMAERPGLAVEKAIRGMLPKNRLGRQMAKKLAVYEGSTHPHEAQRPVALPLGQVPKWEGLPKPPATAPAPRSAAKADGRKESPRRRAGAKSTGRTTTGAGRRAARPRTTGERAATARAGSAKTRTPRKTAPKAKDASGSTSKPSRSRRHKKTEET